MKKGPGSSGNSEDGHLSLFSGERTGADAASLQRLRAVASLPYVRRPVVGLADLHWKQNLEIPSSTATATTEEIVLSLSSPSQNCGMTLLRTPWHVDELREDGLLPELMNAFRKFIPRSRRDPIVTREEVLRLAMRGAREAVSQYGLDPGIVEGIEEGGALFEEGEIDRSLLLDVLDDKCIDKARFSFAFVGGGNHFLEVQAAEELLEPEACGMLGVKPGQIMVMYHTGSERFGHDLGRLFAVRLKTSRRRRRKYFLRKIPLHLMRGVRGPRHVSRRWRYHFSRDTYVPVPADSPDGRRLVVSLKAAGNYGYANRVAVLDLIVRAFRSVAPGHADGFKVISDLSHNVISRERVGDQDLWVHRHNAVRIRPPADWPAGSLYRRTGQPSMLPGTNRSSSYMLLSRDGASKSLNSADHGAGRTVERFQEAGWCRELRDRRTLKFTYRSPGPEELPHVSDEGIDEVVSVLKSAEIAAPALKLRPLAVLKG